MSTADMPLPSPWRYVASASSKFSSVKGYLSQSTPTTRVASPVNTTDDQRQSWRAWASQKIRGKDRAGQGTPNKEVLTLFPGWAARRYPQGTLKLLDESMPFEVEVFVSGYAFTTRSKEQASRSQRAFIRLAKSFASLPRISDPSSPTEDSVSRPPTPMQAPEELQAKLLDRQLQQAEATNSDSNSESFSDSSTPSQGLPTYFTPTPPPIEVHTPADLLQKWHYNLETRLQPFWSSALPSRNVRFHFFIDGNEASERGQPLATQDVTTGADGSFTSRFKIGWDDLCKHAKEHMALREPITEHNLFIVAELLPPPPSTCHTSSANSSPLTSESPEISPSATHIPTSHPESRQSSFDTTSTHHPHLQALLSSITSTIGSTLTSILTSTSTASTHIRVPITHCPMRVISDIDDTVKLSGVPDGARAVFHNVFVKELEDGIIRGMGEWYSRMYEKGVRFHYVSNGPYGYLSVLHEFFEISKLPPGSIKLKSYAGRSFLNGLLSTPAARKRAGVVEILDSFPDSKFILIGDSGEQDMELYADLAREKPDQIRAVFIRDAEAMCYLPIDDPTGWRAVAAGRAGTRPSSEPLLDYSTNTAPSTSSPPSSPRDERDRDATLKARPKRTVSATSAYTRASQDPKPSPAQPSPSVVFTHRPLSEEPTADAGEESIHTPTQSRFPTLPHRSTKSSTYITTPPLPVLPPSVSSPNPFRGGVGARGTDPAGRVRSSTDSSSRTPHQTSRHPSARPKSPRSSTGSTSSSSSSYYKGSDPYSRLGSLSSFSRLSRFVRRDSTNVTNDVDDNETVTPDPGATAGNARNFGYVAYTRQGSGGGSSGGTSGSGSSSSGGRLSEAEKKRMELQARVHRARTQMPSGVPLRLFRDPVECEEEVGGILGGNGGWGV